MISVEPAYGLSENELEDNIKHFLDNVNYKNNKGGVRDKYSKSEGLQNNAFADALNKLKSDNDVKFSLKKPIEETRDLIALHNITATNLNKALELGAFPMPSIAITKADIGHSNFGDISLVFSKDTIDPNNKKNKVYSADAWTPTFPKVEYEADYDKAYQIERYIVEKSKSLAKEYEEQVYMLNAGLYQSFNDYRGIEGLIEKALDTDGMKALYLQEAGKIISEDNLNSINANEYRLWLDSLYDGLEAGRGLYNGKDMFTSSGNRRTFKQLHYPVTVENIVKAMLGQGNVKNNVGFLGSKTVRAVASTNLKSIDDIKNTSHRLKKLSPEQLVEISDRLDERMTHIIDKVASNTKNAPDYRDAKHIGNVILEVAAQKNISKFRGKGITVHTYEQGNWTIVK